MTSNLNRELGEKTRRRWDRRKSVEALLKSLSARAADVTLQRASVVQSASHLWEDLNTPTSLGLYLCMKYGDMVSVVQHKFQISCYEPVFHHSVDRIDRDYQAVSYLSKVRWEISGLDPTNAAISSVSEFEEVCRLTNERFTAYSDGGLIPPALNQVLHLMQGIISRVLGDLRPDEWVEACRFGPGACYKVRGTTSYDKIGAKPSVTMDFALLGLALVNSSPSWISSVRGHGKDDFSGDEPLDNPEPLTLNDLQLVRGGNFSLVPKKATTHRDIEVQPALNVYAQLGLGAMIRKRLKRSGLDLDRQPAINRELARLGSIYNHNATIDMRGASNTISKKLVEFLFPVRWFCALDICRTRYLENFPEKGGLLPLERFASMGNGYTFELESLIFWALAKACASICGEADHEIAVFGDDVVCGQQTAKLFAEYVPALGFIVNQDKSFFSGPFRESCGEDYLLGSNIRPYFYKGTDTDGLQSIVSLCNGLRRKSMQASQGVISDSLYYRCWSFVQRLVPTDIRLTLSGPWSEQDQWFIEDSGVYLRNRALQYRNWCWTCPSVVMSFPRITPHSYFSAKAAMLYGLVVGPLTDATESYYADAGFYDFRSKRRCSPFAVLSKNSLKLTLTVTSTEVNPCGQWSHL